MFLELLFLSILLVIVQLLVFLTGFIYFYFALIIAVVLLLPGFIAPFFAPFVPSSKDRVGDMMRLAGIKKGDKVYDLGAGDGRIITEASKQGAIATGFEISLPLVIIFYLKRTVLRSKGSMIWKNFWKSNLSDADIVFCYLFPHTMKRFEKDVYPRLKPKTKVVCNSFGLPGLKPDKKIGATYLYIKKT